MPWCFKPWNERSPPVRLVSLDWPAGSLGLVRRASYVILPYIVPRYARVRLGSARQARLPTWELIRPQALRTATHPRLTLLTTCLASCVPKAQNLNSPSATILQHPSSGAPIDSLACIQRCRIERRPQLTLSTSRAPIHCQVPCPSSRTNGPLHQQASVFSPHPPRAQQAWPRLLTNLCASVPALGELGRKK